MPDAIGIDGCKAGWVVVRRSASGAPTCTVTGDLGTVFADPSVAVVAIDVPIGLLEAAVPGGRACDRAARTLLGSKRASSVFSAPVRPVLGAPTFVEAAERSLRSSPHRLKISQQCFAITPKIAQVDALMTTDLQRRVVEVHPECSFAGMNGGTAVADPKKRTAGRAARAGLLSRAWDLDAAAWLAAQRQPGVALDDVLDAMAACWTAERLRGGVAQRLPEMPEVDRRGLRMEIWV
jgi:predicted RNase H-like nuclease